MNNALTNLFDTALSEHTFHRFQGRLCLDVHTLCHCLTTTLTGLRAGTVFAYHIAQILVRIEPADEIRKR